MQHIMIEKEIKAIITDKLNQGTEKEILYNEFKGEVNDELLRKILASRPSYQLKLGFKRKHFILSIIWVFFILIELIIILDLMVSFDFKLFVSLIVSIYITINIWKFDGRFFFPGILWFAFTILNTLRELNSIYQYDSDYKIILIFALVYSIILVVGIYLMYNIRKNIFSYYTWFKLISDPNSEIQFKN
jgi:hypothetical protein